MSRIWLLPSLASLFLLCAGPAGAFLGILSPGLGFGVFLVAIALAGTSAIALAGAAAFASATGQPWRRQALLGAVVPFLIVVPVMLASRAGNVPPINDISTDLDDPPQLTPDVAAGTAEAPPPLVAQQIAALQRDAYPELAPLRLAQPPATAFASALDTARGMPGWDVTAEDSEAGRIEAVATSAIFRFRDDVVIRVLPDADGSRIDMRSRSRVGRSDLGANAARIRDYMAALQSP